MMYHASDTPNSNEDVIQKQKARLAAYLYCQNIDSKGTFTQPVNACVFRIVLRFGGTYVG